MFVYSSKRCGAALTTDLQTVHRGCAEAGVFVYIVGDPIPMDDVNNRDALVGSASSASPLYAGSHL